MSSGLVVFVVFLGLVLLLLAADYFFRQRHERHEKPDQGSGAAPVGRHPR